MTAKPTLPKTKRSFDGLDELIDHSIAQKGKYDEMNGSVGKVSLQSVDQTRGEQPATSSTITEPPLSAAVAERVGTDLERLQVKIPKNLLLASKIYALKAEISLSKFVERALRQHLDSPQE